MDEVPSHARSFASGRVKNKAPAKVQITAEQLLREAWERKEVGPSAVPKQQIADKEELLEFQRTERKQFEMRIVRNRSHTPLWIRYARWEEAQEEFGRARSVWERAVDNDYRNPAVWLGYSEMEMRHRFVNHARNVFDRAVALLPRVDQLWLKYAHFEELLDQADLARLVYSRWLKWMPGPSAYFAFIRFELRHGAVARARGVYNDLVRAHRTAHSYIKFAKFEERQGEFARARNVYSRATEELASPQQTAGLFLSFAKFEERRKQAPRARAIYSFAVKQLPKDEAFELHRAYTSFEKQQGERTILDDLLVTKKREAFNETLRANPHDYDSWFDLLQMEEVHSSPDKIRETYERALVNVPPSMTKPAWRRYIYLWISYAVWEELSSDSPQASVAIYARAIAAIPNKHRHFSFGKLWLLYAQAHLRAGDVAAARRALGAGLGVLPDKDDLYRAYVQIEGALGDIPRARKVYQSWLARQPTRGDIFLEMAEFEAGLDEVARAAAVLAVAVDVPGLTQREEVWQKYVELELDSERADKGVNALFERFVVACPVAKAWLAYTSHLQQHARDSEKCRETFGRAARELKGRAVEEGGEGAAEELRLVAVAWLAWEESVEAEGETDGQREERIGRVKKTMPSRVRRKRPVMGVDGTHQGWEEYWQTVLPQEDESGQIRKDMLLEAARRWKMGQAAA